MKGEINAADPSKSVPQGYAEVEHAHEVSHQMGLLDEYEDIHVKDRKTHTDHSLMGDYANEGIDKVTLAPRHGERDGEDHRPRDGQGADIADGARRRLSRASPLSDSNRRPPPSHALRNGCRGLPLVADRLV